MTSEKNTGGSGDLAALSAGATKGELQRHGSHVYGPDPERKLIAQFLNMGATAADTPIEANADFTIALWNAYRSGRLIEAPTPDPVAQGEPVAWAAHRDAVEAAYTIVDREMWQENWSTAHPGHKALTQLKDLALKAPAAPRSDTPPKPDVTVPHPLHGGKPYPAHVVFADLAAQEGCDGAPYDTMQAVADALKPPTNPKPNQGGGRWPNGCIKPGSCGRHAACMYAMSAEKCRHFGKDLTADVAAAQAANTAGGQADA